MFAVVERSTQSPQTYFLKTIHYSFLFSTFSRFIIPQQWLNDGLRRSKPTLLLLLVIGTNLGLFIAEVFPILLIFPTAKPSTSSQKVSAEMYKSTCHNPNKHPTYWWGIEILIKGSMIIDWPNMILFAGIILTVSCFYNFALPSTYFTYGTGFLIKEFYNLSEKIKNLIKVLWIKLKENRIWCLGAVFQLLNIASSLLRGAERWKSSFIAGIAIFALLSYCFEVYVEQRRATGTFFYPERMNNILVWFFTKKHVLPALVPVLTCVYKTHHMENISESVSFSIQMFINVAGQLTFMYARDLHYFYGTNRQHLA